MHAVFFLPEIGRISSREQSAPWSMPCNRKPHETTNVYIHCFQLCQAPRPSRTHTQHTHDVQTRATTAQICSLFSPIFFFLQILFFLFPSEFIDEFDLVFASAFNVCQYHDSRLASRVGFMCATLPLHLPLNVPVDPRCSTMYLTNDFRTNSPISNGRTARTHPLATNPCRP